jgi:cytochrome P450
VKAAPPALAGKVRASRAAAAVTVAALETDPHPVLARLRATAPVAWVPVLGAWLVTGYGEAVAVLRDARTFTVDDPPGPAVRQRAARHLAFSASRRIFTSVVQ